MNRDDLSRLAIVARVLTDGDVRPEDVTTLHPSRIEIPGAGWTERETGLPPPDTDRSEMVIVWGLAALAFWTIGLSLLFWGMKAGWLR